MILKCTILVLLTELACAYIPLSLSQFGSSNRMMYSQYSNRVEKWSNMMMDTSKSIRSKRTCLLNANLDTDLDQEMYDELINMKVKELKSELNRLNVFIGDVFEKEELVRRLYKARQEMSMNEGYTAETNDSNDVISDDEDISEVIPERMNESFTESMNESMEDEKMKNDSIPSYTTISGPMSFISLDGFKSVQASNNNNLYLKPSPGQFPAAEFNIIPASNNSDNTITVLIDTACSGIVLRPSIVEKFQLPTFQSPMTMTAAGGSRDGTFVSQIPNIQLASNDILEQNKVLKGPFPVAVQDIGALPTQLDGIMGLSFLSQYQVVDFNFDKYMISITKIKENQSPPPTSSEYTIVAEAGMELTNIGIFIVDVILDGKGPVRMLVDTGATSTILNWKGVSDMGLSESSPLIAQNSMMGAMGADNIAISLTHFYMLKRRYNFVERTNVGMNTKSRIGVKISRGKMNADSEQIDGPVKIDIGDLPVLNSLQNYGVGGILGSDLLMKCDLLRLLDMNGPKPKIILYEK